MPRIGVALLNQLGLTEQSCGPAFDSVYTLGWYTHLLIGQLRSLSEAARSGVAAIEELASIPSDASPVAVRLQRAVDAAERLRRSADNADEYLRRAPWIQTEEGAGG